MQTSFDYTAASLAAISMAAMVVMAGCGSGTAEPAAAPAAPAQTRAAAAPVPPRPMPSAHLGAVTHIEALTERPKGSGVGAVAGGVLGGVVGHQVGDGNGQKAATVVGAVGGALLGNKIERDRAEKVTGYRVDVRMDNGDVRSFQQTDLNGLSVGSRVRSDGGSLRPA
jgi:outer membrane lipoprotein SlyB